MINTKIAQYHVRVEEQLKQLMSNVSKCFGDHEKTRHGRHGQNVCGGKGAKQPCPHQVPGGVRGAPEGDPNECHGACGALCDYR
eukprot:4987354-Lingulodinium_polyedra.AAC.1